MKKEQSAKFLKICLADALLRLMERKAYVDININEVCEKAGVGRTTYYRYFDNKSSKENLLVFKVVDEWKTYVIRHEEENTKNSGKVFLDFMYENRKIFRLLFKNNLIICILNIFEEYALRDLSKDKESSYLAAFFIYAFFGVLYQWIKYDFDETPDEVQNHISNTIAKAIQTQKDKI